MGEKLIIISCEDTIIDSFCRVFSGLGIHFYCVHNNVKLISAMEFEAFVFVEIEFN